MSKDYKHIQTKEDYTKLLNSGMFWEFHPELNGNWQDDEKVIKNINYDAVLATDACLHPMQSRVRTHRGYHCGDCGKRF